MRARRTEAEIGFRLESAGQSERLTILEPATIPEFPFTGSRKKLVLMGAAASILAGLGLAFLLELRDPVLRTAYRMERETGLKPVVTIPVVRPRRARGGLLKRLFRRRPASSA
jgi:capsular polysaccharide biosynthesis protein